MDTKVFIISTSVKSAVNTWWSSGPVGSSTFKILMTLIASIAMGVGDYYHPIDESLRVGAPNDPEKNPEFWRRQAEASIGASLAARQPTGNARNVILFLGDGMSQPTLTAARIRLGQLRGHTGEEAELYFESFPTTGLVKTYCTNSQVGESACTSTAYMCGVKTNSGCIGVSAAVRRGDCAGASRTANRVQSIAEWALADGRDVGIVTTARVTDASPAGAFAKTADRAWENDALVKADGHNPRACPDIAYQLVHMHPGNKFKVILGGGRQNFLPKAVRDQEGAPGKRLDHRNLIVDWQKDKAQRHSIYRYIWNRNQLMSANKNLPQYLLGLFESDHMKFNMVANKSSEPTLAELTETAVKMLRRNKRGFFLFVEAGLIDHAHHANRVHLALDETIQLSHAVARASQLLTDKDSLMLVTADHGHAMAINGYSVRGHDILDSNTNKDGHKISYMTLSYTNGPGARTHANGVRPDVTRDANYRAMAWRPHADFFRRSATHSGDDVAVFARGPRHALFSGLYEQSQLAHRMAWAACIGPGRRACAAPALARAGAASAAARPAAPATGPLCTLVLAVLPVLCELYNR